MIPNTVGHPGATECPQCGYVGQPDATECSRCQVVFEKLRRGEEREAAIREESLKLGGSVSVERLAGVERLMIHQQVERLEIWTGFEQANNYQVVDSAGNLLFLVAEESNVWARQLLKGFRPFTMHVATPSGEPVLLLRRPYRFYFQEVQVEDAQGRQLGWIRKRFSWLNRRYTLMCGAVGREFEILGPLLKPWTFEIRRKGVTQGTIRKSWSGALKEMFTDADSFGVEFPREMDVRLKSVFLGAVFLIDMLHFEENND